MGAKEKRLGQILDKYYVRSNSKVDIKDILNSNYQSEILDVYTQLDGVRENYNFRGKWDFLYKDFILELDEEAHFNRYRALTLTSNLYDEISYFPINKYKDFCKKYEDKCLKKGYGKYWASTSTEKMFGPSDLPKSFVRYGSSRWKQRAFYDYVKDVSYLYTGIPVVRLSIYDQFQINGKELSLEQLLVKNNLSDEYIFTQLTSLIAERKPL